MEKAKYSKENLPEKVKLLNKVGIFPKGYELKRRGKIAYFQTNAVHGLPTSEVIKALNSGKAKAL